MYKFVIFDLDGTLLNTLEDLADAGNFALETMGFPVHETEKYKYFVGNGIPKLIERIVPKNCTKEDTEKVHGLFSEYYRKHCVDKTKHYENISEMLSDLNNKNIKIGVATNKDHNFSIKLVKDFFGDTVDIVCGRKDGFPKKPNPYSVNLILEQFKADKKQTLYVGDSNVDMETAKNADLDSCGVLWGFRTETELRESGAKYIAHSVEELYKIITKPNKG